MKPFEVNVDEYCQRLEIQCAAMNRQLILQSMQIEELTKELAQYAPVADAADGGPEESSLAEAVAGNGRL